MRDTLQRAIDAAARRFNAEADKLIAEAQKTRMDIITTAALLILVVLGIATVLAQIRILFFR